MSIRSLIIVAIIWSCQISPLVMGKPIPRDQNAIASIITKFTNIFLPNGGYYFSYETSDGQAREESAEFVPGQNKEEGTLKVAGQYRYMGPDGKPYEVQYTSDEEGYQPYGEHIPMSAGVRKLGIPSAAIASLAGGGLGR